MGQSSSRPRSSTTPASSSSSSSSSPRSRDQSIVQDGPSSTREQPDAAPGPPPAKRSRRSSLRRSILGFIPAGPSSSSSASSSTRTAKDNPPSTANPGSEGQHSFRKRWRSSRRWSKAPAQLAQLTPSAQEPAVIAGDRDAGSAVASSPLGVAEVIPIATPSHSSLSSTPLPASRSSSPRLGALAQAPAEGPHDEDRPLDTHASTPETNTNALPTVLEPSDVELPPSPSPHPHPSVEDIEREVNEFLNGRAVHTHDDLPALDAGSDVPAEQPTTSAEPSAQQAPSPRTFPPPGTLVVVQGVVNTTDSPHAQSQTTQPAQNNTSTPVRSSTATSPQSQPGPISRRRSLSIPRSGSRSNANEERHRRHRLSSLIRPSSMLGRGLGENGSRGPPASSSTPEFNPLDTSSPNGEAAPPPPDTSSAASVGDGQVPPPSDSSAGSRGLSQGSIDVLGTLLSVAAAATAASLFSPGLPYSATGTNGVAPLNTGNRPLSPTPTAGLGALGGLGGMSGLGLNPAVAHSSPGATQDSRDRIRNMWESIRERVGLNPRNATASTAGPSTERQVPSDDSGTGDRQRMRPGELMLAEMARALNAGLGLTNTAERRQGQSQGQGEPVGTGAGAGTGTGAGDPTASNNVMFAPIWDPSQPLPPEGSFERFLVNLQADLRIVLSDEGFPASDNAQAVATPVAESVGTSATVGESSHAVEDTVQTPDLSGQESDVGDVPPPLAEDSDSDSDSGHSLDENEGERDEDDGGDDAEDDPTDHPAQPAPRTPTPIPPAGGISFGQEHGPSADTAGGRTHQPPRPAINLWRLYRFDPIPAIQAQDQTAHPTPLSTPENMSSTELPQPPEPVSPTPGSAEGEPSTSTEQPGAALPQHRPAPEQPANVVVPVIVVGLQSVDVPGQDEHEEEPPVPNDLQNGVASSSDASNEAQDGAAPPGRTGSTRGRTWHSRAASALRTLRPGRRAPSRGRRTTEGSGSRTFLIYVIGGYYPPNHHMVTGSDTLDSYEALWELAELLGQVKPPTATREEIDKSGLQIIRASEVTHYEREGRLASNCVERCLICLDDYDSDDDLRLMSCRHAFHKDCVDKWLQVGRNNCPACRTKGVSVSMESLSSPELSTSS